ncbi:MAG: carboxylating nicotinate-nucleotide diphosphorylase [Litorivicinaceae bacterium]
MHSTPRTLPADVSRALQEDIRSGDVTADLISETQTGRAILMTREAMVVAGLPYATETFAQVDPGVVITWLVNDGDAINAGSQLAIFEGPARALLMAERTGLNFIQLLSAVATRTHQLAQLLDGTSAKLFDTRKTLPGLRDAQKYAVKVGGGENHRIGLFDQILIKENHIAASGSITQAIQTARRLHPNVKVQVEVETFEELDEALAAQPDIIMLDNFDTQALQQAFSRRSATQCDHIEFEASEGITEENLREIGLSGVDRISLGTLTKDIRAIDLSMRVELS